MSVGNWAIRKTLPCAFQFARAWWFVTRPDHRAALAAIWAGDALLLVKQSYRSTLCLPGGGVFLYESPLAAACREVREELGLALDVSAFSHTMQQIDMIEFRKTRADIFEVTLNSMPEVKIDNREIVGAAFYNCHELPRLNLDPFARGYVAFFGSPHDGGTLNAFARARGLAEAVWRPIRWLPPSRSYG
jgi:8-oxo-dGTP diphosphatase